jgi:phenylalanyl-tRNA synthetase beta chain
MKLSLAWIFDHLNANWQDQDIHLIYRQFNRITAEMEAIHRIQHDLSGFFFVTLGAEGNGKVTCHIPELDKTIQMPARQIALPGALLVKKDGENFSWATHADFNGEKEGALPAFDIEEKHLHGNWRSLWQAKDIIIEVDNKSVTHRPDMWGHRGYAREIGAFLGIKLKPIEDFLTDIPVTVFPKASTKTAAMPISITVEAPQACSRFTALYLDKLANKPCNILVASRLLNIGARPIDGVIDATNYLMHDWGQPVHAYNADAITDGNLVVRMAHAGEQINLLGGPEAPLTPQDTVVADPASLLCLAGVKGGLESGVTATTKRLLFESATWDAGTIRRTAQRHKTRTDASTRYEKTLDPEQTTQACKRFISLLKQVGVEHSYVPSIIQIGISPAPLVITLAHDFLVKRIGMDIGQETVIRLLTALEFEVAHQNGTYKITVPSFRASKDIKIKEDILEEVTRTFGFDNIALTLPQITRTPYSLQAVDRLSRMKHYFVRAACMTEQQNYVLADQPFLATIGYTNHQPITLLNPISEHFSNMVDSLIPGLLKNIIDNHVHNDTLSFFETGRVWQLQDNQPQEKRSVAGVYFKKRTTVDFYLCKHELEQLFVELGFDGKKLVWKKASEGLAPWYHPHQTASLLYAGKGIGLLGKINPTFKARLALDTETDAACFELDGDFIRQEPGKSLAYQPISKYQDTFIDLSLMVPRQLPAANVVTAMQATSPLICNIKQIDSFENKAWVDKRALTYRLWLVSNEKTLEKQDIETVWQTVTEALKALGVEIRG